MAIEIVQNRHFEHAPEHCTVQADIFSEICSQQEEKFNVWVAFLNLENSFADDPERAAADLLQRALQQNDAKKMYLAALDIFQRSQRTSLLQTCAQGTAIPLYRCGHRLSA